MDRCPPELHSYICSLACADDGFTARSLTLVSRYFSQITLPYLYQSVSANGPSQISALARRLEGVPSHHRRIHRLYLSDLSEGDKPSSSDRDLARSILTILSLAAPTLETLAFVAYSPATSTSLIGKLFRLTFPHLHELTVFGYYAFPSIPKSFPSLEHLHLLGNRNPHGLLHLGALETCTPSLTRLQISGLSLAASFSQELCQAFSEKDGDDDEACAFPARLPQKLQQVVVQCGPELGTSRSNPSAAMKDKTMIENLEGLRDRVDRDGHHTRFSVLPRSSVDVSPEYVWNSWVDKRRGQRE